MKSLSKYLASIMVAATLFVAPPKAHAISDVAITILGTTAGLVLTYFLAGGVASVQASSGGKEAVLNVVADDAAAFIMNDGENPSALLSSMMDEMRANGDMQKIDEEITDMDLARAILNQSELALEQ
ncbi:MAG: DUF2388 domain-containing protein [Xanthomonadaceae bacterium]|nr:DUF2388 domain-containing protein [Xanthomonadaceae bacterium]